MSPGPNYILRPGDIVGAPPFRAENCLMQLMLLKGDKQIQQDYVDLILNEPAKGEYYFGVLNDYVLLSALHIGVMRSLDTWEATKGVTSDGDISFWTLVSGAPASKSWAQKLYWVPSFLYVKTPASQSGGREIYGYPKTDSRIQRLGVNNWDPALKVSALHMPHYNPVLAPVWETVLEISAPASPPFTAPISAMIEQTPIGTMIEQVPIDTMIEQMWALLGAVPPIVQGRMAPPSPWAMPQLMLRQFRDPYDLGTASLQEGLVNEAKLLKVNGQGFLGRDATVTITASDSHPVCETLGVPAVSTVNGIWIQQDFEIGAAQKLWG